MKIRGLGLLAVFSIILRSSLVRLCRVSTKGLLCWSEPCASVKLSPDAPAGWAWCLTFPLLAWLEIPCFSVLFLQPLLCNNSRQMAGVGLMAALPFCGSWTCFTSFSAKQGCFSEVRPSSLFSSRPVAYEQEPGQEMDVYVLEACDKGILRVQGSSQNNCLW